MKEVSVLFNGNTYLIPQSTLKALMISAPKNDLRSYLNGVLLDFEQGYGVSTDGHRMTVCRIPVYADAGRVFVNHTAAIPPIVQGVEVGGNHSPGHYPDWKRVVPAVADRRTDRAGRFHIKYMADAEKAMRLYSGNDKADAIYETYGLEVHKYNMCPTAVFTLSNCDIFVVVQGLRDYSETASNGFFNSFSAG